MPWTAQIVYVRVSREVSCGMLTKVCRVCINYLKLSCFRHYALTVRSHIFTGCCQGGKVTFGYTLCTFNALRILIVRDCIVFLIEILMVISPSFLSFFLLSFVLSFFLSFFLPFLPYMYVCMFLLGLDVPMVGWVGTGGLLA